MVAGLLLHSLPGMGAQMRKDLKTGQGMPQQYFPLLQEVFLLVGNVCLLRM
jgi:hypothetical protein